MQKSSIWPKSWQSAGWKTIQNMRINCERSLSYSLPRLREEIPERRRELVARKLSALR